VTERKRFALLGHPVRHSVSPAIHTAAIAALGLRDTYSAIDVPSVASLERVVEELRRGSMSGANVTVPYKRAVVDMVDELAPSAIEVGAVNVLVRTPEGRVVGHNTDAAALAEQLESLRPRLQTTRAVIIGSGGAGLAAIVAAKRVGFRVIGVTSRSWAHSEAMLDSETAAQARALGALTSTWPSESDEPPTSKSSLVLRMQWGELATNADLVIQATSAGMAGGDAGDVVADLVRWKTLPDHAKAIDVIYRPRETPFLAAARKRGLEAHDGVGMLVRQAQKTWSLWAGAKPPLDVLMNAAEEALAADPPSSRR
jgi:shikimate dehydrogenase